MAHLMKWRDLAACAGDGHDLWMSERLTPELSLTCLACDATRDCLAEALRVERDSDLADEGVRAATTRTIRQELMLAAGRRIGAAVDANERVLVTMRAKHQPQSV